MQVGQIMTKNVIGIRADAKIGDAIRIMLGSHISGLPVFDSRGKLVGILSEGDLLRRSELGTEKRQPQWIKLLRGSGAVAEAYTRSHGRKVEEVMTPDVVTTTETTALGDAVDIMTRQRIKRLPVVLGDHVIGIVTRADILRALSKMTTLGPKPASDTALRQSIVTEMRRQQWAPIALIDVDVNQGIVTLNGSVTDERQRLALHVIAENTPGVKAVRDHLMWIEPISGWAVAAPDEDASTNAKA